MLFINPTSGFFKRLASVATTLCFLGVSSALPTSAQTQQLVTCTNSSEIKTISNVRFTPQFILSTRTSSRDEGGGSITPIGAKGQVTFTKVEDILNTTVKFLSVTNMQYTSNAANPPFQCAVPTPLPSAAFSPSASVTTYDVGTCNNSAGTYVIAYTAQVVNAVGTLTDGGSCQRTFNATPIVIDVLGDGYRLTDATQGVWFDYPGTGIKELTSWTAAGEDDAFLALDRNGNGSIDNAGELFGNYTDQPSTKLPRNGFLALALFDLPSYGGNDDGVVDSKDKMLQKLLLWRDADHDGVSSPDELSPLISNGITGISLDYRLSRRTDQYGNEFRYRSKVLSLPGAPANRWAWDIIFTTSS
jgi:hypothetical protein